MVKGEQSSTCVLTITMTQSISYSLSHNKHKYIMMRVTHIHVDESITCNVDIGQCQNI